MSTTIFQPEITTLEADIAQMQAAIATAQERISKLAETEILANSWLEAGATLKEKVRALAPEALAKITSSIINLFQDGNNPDDDGTGNEPITPALTPGDDGGEPEEAQSLPLSLEPQPELGSELLTSGSQYCIWASPWASPLASPLCCPLEDAPQSVLVGQAVDLAAIVFSRDGFKYINYEVTVEQKYFDLIQLDDAIAYFFNNKTGEVAATYIGFASKSKAEKWGRYLTGDRPIATGFELRYAKRLSKWQYELKLWGLSSRQIQELADCDLRKSPPINYSDAPKRKVDPVAPVPTFNPDNPNPTTTPKSIQIDAIEVGDIVRSSTIKNWQYKVVGIKDGMYSCQQINVESPIKVPMHPASIELVSKAHSAAQEQSEAAIASNQITPEQAKASLFGESCDVPEQFFNSKIGN